MSINVEGVPAPVPTDVTPSPATLGFTTATHLVSASSFINTDVTATAPSLSFTPVNASANNNVNVNNTLPSLTFSGLNHTIVGQPETQETPVNASAPTLTITGANADIVAVNTPSTSDTPDYPDPVAGVTLLGGRTTVNVSNDAELADALLDALEGQTIQLAAGTYSNTHTIDKTAPANNPIIVKGASNFTSICTNSWTMDGDRNIVTGILFSGANVQFQFYGNNNKLIGNKITGWGDSSDGTRNAVRARYSTFNEIAYNEFYEPGPWSDASVNGTSFSGRHAIRTAEGSSGANHPTDSWYHHNLFRDFPDKPRPSSYGSGQNDALEWGETNVRSYTLTFDSRLYFESNMLLRHLQGVGGPTAGSVDFKTGGVVARYNTYIDTPGAFDMRSPSAVGVVFESNYLDSDAKGMRIHGCANRLIGNEVNGASIDLIAGNRQCAEKNAVGQDHSRCSNAVVAGNIASLKVGVDRAGGTYPCNNTLIEEHTGSISLQNQTGTTNNSGQSTSINFAPAVALTQSQVGPAGLSLAPQAYKDARGL